MGIGTSKGAFYEDDFEYLRSQWDRKYDTNDQNVIHPNQVEQGQQLDAAELDPTTGMGIDIGYRVPAGVDWQSLNKPTGSVSMTDVGDSPLSKGIDNFKAEAGKTPPSKIEITPEDIDQAINVGLGAGPGTIVGAMSKIPVGAKGWWKGSDGKWRNEISDEGMKLKDRDWVHGEEGKLSDFLEHPELFKHYPELANTKFQVLPKDHEYIGAYFPRSKTLAINPSKVQDDKHLLDVMSHELQHAVQGIEGFALGSNPDAALNKSLIALSGKLDSLPPGPQRDEISALVKDIQANAKEFGQYMYSRTPGEVEANIVAARRQLTDKQREMISPNELNKMLEGEKSNLHGGKYVPEFNYP